jgi:hypothetical protein
LKLLREAELAHILPGTLGPGDLEASGVCAKDGSLYVVFDHFPHVAQIEAEFSPGRAQVTWRRQRGAGGFEDITYDHHNRRFYLLIEASQHESGVWQPKIEEYDEHFQFVDSHWLDYEIDPGHSNKGFEGLTYLRRGRQDYLFGMCEGNKCQGGKAGRRPGNGRLHVFARAHDRWEHAETLKMPEAVQFKDYAGTDIAGEQLAVVSQASSALWVGRLKKTGWELVDDGIVYEFPRRADGEILYCNVEGVAWLDAKRVAVVSDRARRRERERGCAEKAQSIHLFELPRPAGAKRKPPQRSGVG